MERIKWYIKQLLPLKYESTFREKGVMKHCVWRMWFGRCFDILEREVTPEYEYVNEFSAD
jgi:hypothetical protein